MIYKDNLANTMLFFDKAFPVSKPKNFRTQIGVHMEEFAEMIDALEFTNEGDKYLMHYLNEAIKAASNHMKQESFEIKIKDREELLDAICDQIVTAAGIAYHSKMDVVNGLNEVNRSNFSKFDENGEPLLDNNLKLIKSSLYTKPNLKSFV